MRNYKSLFTTAALYTLLALGFQQLNYGDHNSNLAIADTTQATMAINYVAISVPNYQETLQWYQNNFDATIEKEWTAPKLPHLKLAYLNISGFRLKVIGNAQSSSFPNLKTTGLAHLSFQVDNVDEVMNKLKERGVNTFVEGTDYQDLGVRVGFIKDNNGNVIELVQNLRS